MNAGSNLLTVAPESRVVLSARLRWHSFTSMELCIGTTWTNSLLSLKNNAYRLLSQLFLIRTINLETVYHINTLRTYFTRSFWHFCLSFGDALQVVVQQPLINLSIIKWTNCAFEIVLSQSCAFYYSTTCALLSLSPFLYMTINCVVIVL